MLFSGCGVLVTLLLFALVLDSEVLAAPASSFGFPLGAGYARRGFDFLSKIDFCAIGHAEFCRKYGTAWHNGEDWNKAGGGVFGDLIYSVANGEVITSGKYGGCFGHTVMAEHVPPSGAKFTLPDGSRVNKAWSNYVHMSDRSVGAGQTVSKGQKVGEIGTGDCWPPHLHWEIRYRYLSATANTLNFRKDQILYYFVDPSDFINKNRRVECYLIKGSGPAIYFVEKGEKRWIPNPVTFEEGLRFSWGDVCRISDGELATYPTGPPIPSVTSHWVISHFKGRNLSMPPVIIRGRPRGWFDIGWGYGSPDPSIPGDNFSSRYVTKFPFEAGTYDFRFVTDDGLRFWIDGSKVIDAWVDQARVFEVSRSITKGNHFLRIEHFEGYVTSRIAVSWWHTSWFTLIQHPEDDTVVTIKPASGGGLQIVVYGQGGPYRWLTDAYAAIRWVYRFASPVFVSWEQYDKDHSLLLTFLIEGMDGQDRLLVYAANAPNRWYEEGWVDMGPRTETYNQWESFTRNLEADYIDEFGVAPKLGKEIRIGHFVNDAWVGDHGGTIQNISFVEEVAPPVTSISFDPPSPNGENDWYISDLTVTLSAAAPAGIERTEYNLGTGWITYTAPFVISQEEVTEILYRSIDKAGNVEETRSAVVGLDKTPPVVAIGGPYSGEEGSAVNFNGSGSYDEISGIQSYSWEFTPGIEGQETPQPSAYASYTWGDNGNFTASFSVKDMAGWVADDQTSVPIANAAPTVILDRLAMVLFPAETAFLTRVEESFTLAGNVTDLGSDDLELTFDFGEGIPRTQAFLNDPEVGSDPSPSPEINPRDVTTSASYEYQSPGIYQPNLDATDDDSGESLDQDYALVQDDGTVGIRTMGFWKYQFGVGEGVGNLIPQETLERYLEITDFVTAVFTGLDSTQAREILTKDEDGNPMRDRAEAQYLALLLNFATGSIDWDQAVDTDFDGISDTIFSEAILGIDAILSNPDSTDAELEMAKDIADGINNMGD